MFRKFIIIISLALITSNLSAQSAIIKDFETVCDSLSTLIKERTSVEGKLKVKSIVNKGTVLNFYFSESLGDWPWDDEGIKWFRKTLTSLLPNKYKGKSVGEIYSRGVNLNKLSTSGYSSDGRPVVSKYNVQDYRNRQVPIVTNTDNPKYKKGLSGRTIALWQSHGRFYDQGRGMWMWQRPCLFTTSEDLFTQGLVLDFLVPMLENAGAYTMLPRERDCSNLEYIVDNDPYNTEGAPRGHGRFTTDGVWELCGTGFADTKPFYEDLDNPFSMGTTIKTRTISHDSKEETKTAEWIPYVKEKKEYAVYISYQSLPKSTDHAVYKVIHDGGTTNFTVNQKIGGSTWIYLGSFTFRPGAGHRVILENREPERTEDIDGNIITADAVKFGGGMGNIARKKFGDNKENAEVSGLPRYLEGARYWLQWAGIDNTIWNQHEQKDDYKDDFMSRGPWVEHLTGGSRINPKMEGKGIPVDLSFALHSDAGRHEADSTVGTLAIYTYKSDNKTYYPNGQNRMAGREYADIIQSQVVDDIRALYDTTWNRRNIWDRYYNECRRPTCPAMILEFLSHQNFPDMKYGMDPSFRFTVSRSIYKGMLKFLSNRYGYSYAVQPLPVHDFTMSKAPEQDIVVLRWRETEDKLEPTASAKGFILETRIGDGSFDQGKIVIPEKTQDGYYLLPVRMRKGKIWSFRIRAFNDGGKSFPSEILSAGFPIEQKEDCANDIVLIVNNFDRVSSPSWFDTPTYAGFDARTDRGVPYMRDITYMGDIYEFRKDKEWVTNDNSGFGACYRDYTGKILAGNTFDYPAVHGGAIMKTGRAFISTSASAFMRDEFVAEGINIIDMICGKQITSISGTGHKAPRFTVFPDLMQKRIKEYCEKGGNILISGANIATDIWDTIYPIEKDSIFTDVSKKFAKEVLGYSWGGNHASKLGRVTMISDDKEPKTEMEFHTMPNPDIYSVEAPDGILPARKGSKTWFRYTDTEVSAGIKFNGSNYKTIILGFPIETLKTQEDMEEIIKVSLDWFSPLK